MNKTMTWRRVLAASLAAMLAMSLAACSEHLRDQLHDHTGERNEELVLGNRRGRPTGSRKIC